MVDYYSRFLVMKKVCSLAVDDLVQTGKMILAEYGLPKRIISDAGTNFTSETFRELQVDEHLAAHTIILLLWEQWPSGGMHKIWKLHN